MNAHPVLDVQEMRADKCFEKNGHLRTIREAEDHFGNLCEPIPEDYMKRRCKRLLLEK